MCRSPGKASGQGPSPAQDGLRSSVYISREPDVVVARIDHRSDQKSSSREQVAQQRLDCYLIAFRIAIGSRSSGGELKMRIFGREGRWSIDIMSEAEEIN